MSDSDLFGVEDPESGQVGYCCVLGELGEIYGLVVYLGAAGLEQYRKIQSGKLRAGSPDLAYSQTCLTAWFTSRGDLDDIDTKILRELRLKFRGSDAWPQFRSLQPGYLPWYLAENEAKFLTVCLEQAGEVSRCFERDPDWLTAPARNLYLVRVQSEQADPRSAAEPQSSTPSPGQQALWAETAETRVRQWDNRWLRPVPPVRPPIRRFPLDEIRIRRIKKNSQAHPMAWEIDAFYTPMPVEGADRPFFPYTFLCVDHHSGFLLGTVLADSSRWEMEFSKTFLDNLEEHKLLPSKLCLRKKELQELLAPLALQLGIEVELTKKLPAVDRAKRELLRFMNKRP